MKKITIDGTAHCFPSNYSVKTYGNEPTMLRLTGKAEEAYKEIDPLEIYEIKNNESGIVYYYMDGAMVCEREPEETIIRFLEEAYDEIVGPVQLAIQSLQSEFVDYKKSISNKSINELTPHEINTLSAYSTIVCFVQEEIVSITDEQAVRILNQRHPLENIFRTMYDPDINTKRASHTPLSMSEADAIEESLNVIEDIE